MVRLETARLILRDHELSDLEPYCEMESDPIYRAPQIVHPRAELERSGGDATTQWHDYELLPVVSKRTG